MINLLKRLFGLGCKHYWEVIKTETFRLYDYPYNTEMPVGKKYVITQRCSKCGDVKMKKYEM